MTDSMTFVVRVKIMVEVGDSEKERYIRGKMSDKEKVVIAGAALINREWGQLQIMGVEVLEP